MEKVYAITEGSYSDYHIVTICSSKPIANRWKSSNSDFNIETYTVDDNPPIKMITVNMEKDGSIRYVTSPEMVNSYYKKTISYFKDFKTNKKYMTVNVLTGSKITAIKTANEIRIQLIALDIWGNNKLSLEFFNNQHVSRPNSRSRKAIDK